MIWRLALVAGVGAAVFVAAAAAATKWLFSDEVLEGGLKW